MTFDTIHLTVTNRIAVVQMRNPPVNAMSPRMREELTAAFTSFEDKADVGVAVLTGSGKAFCAGIDLKTPPPTGAAQRAENSRLWRMCTDAIEESRVPVIGAINGYALGAGLGLASCCDILIASDQAEMGLPEIDRGLLGGGRRALRLFGRSHTRSMAFRGVRFKAADLLRLGVVEQVVEADRLIETATEIAAEIARKDPEVLQLTKLTLNASEDMPGRSGYHFEQAMSAQLAERRSHAR